MDYEAMTGGELQKECARRGLPSSRAAKAIMVKRLTDHDAEQGAAVGVLASPETAQEEAGTVLAPRLGTESVIPAHVIKDTQAGLTAADPVRAFRQTFPAEPDGPDEETHLAYRQATLQAAADAGYRTRGDARLAATVGDRWMYEVSVRRVT